MEKLRNNKGITLVSLVVTIIVILILAGIAVVLSVGNNGVITRASVSAIENKRGIAQEEVALAYSSCLADYWAAWASNGNVAKSTYITKEKMDGYMTRGETTAFTYNASANTATGTYKNTKSGNDFTTTFTIDANGNVTLGTWTNGN